jgi:hypothetical protein
MFANGKEGRLTRPAGRVLSFGSEFSLLIWKEVKGAEASGGIVRSLVKKDEGAISCNEGRWDITPTRHGSCDADGRKATCCCCLKLYASWEAETGSTAKLFGRGMYC